MFNLKPAELGPFDGIWECNAIVSINVKDRMLCISFKVILQARRSNFDDDLELRAETAPI